MSRTLSFMIPGDTNELSPNQRLHWQARRRLVQRWRAAACVCFLAAEDGDVFYGERVRITFTLRRGRLLDPDNAHASGALKAIVDGLTGRAYPGDSARYVEFGPIRQESGARYRLQPEVEVLLEALEGGSESG